VQTAGVPAGWAGGKIATPAELDALIGALAASPDGAPLAAAALAAVRHGVITGEGPTTLGRVHYSRTIDAHDTALVERILLAGGERPISRAEADLLFDIHDAALDRADGGAFADLFARAIAHHVLAAAGHPVPARAAALATGNPIADWMPDGGVPHGETAAWLAGRLNRRREAGPLAALAAGLGVAMPWSASVAAVIDLAA
jgi:hypothetical protein